MFIYHRVIQNRGESLSSWNLLKPNKPLICRVSLIAKAACTFKCPRCPERNMAQSWPFHILTSIQNTEQSEHWGLASHFGFGHALQISATYHKLTTRTGHHWASILKFWPWRAICVSLDLQWFIVWNSPLRTDSSWYLHIASNCIPKLPYSVPVEPALGHYAILCSWDAKVEQTIPKVIC